MPVTIKQIAADLGLAISTVSKALRNSHEISAETSLKVFEYAAKVGYKPNPYASSLKGRKSGNIAVVLPEVADSFFSSAIDGIEEVAQEKGYHVIVYLTHEDVERERSILREFRHRRVDGVLISIAANDSNYDHLHELYDQHIPMVFFDRVCEDVKTARVVTDDFQSGYNATKLLLEKGCKRIAFLSMEESLAIVRLRMEGHSRAMDDLGRDAAKSEVILCSHNESDNLKLMRTLLSAEERPDGLIGSLEKLTTQAYTVSHELGLSIPHQIRVIGFSHLPIASLLNPSLTTITQPAFEMGKTAATILLKALDKKNPVLNNEQIILPSRLVERSSTS